MMIADNLPPFSPFFIHMDDDTSEGLLNGIIALGVWRQAFEIERDWHEMQDIGTASTQNYRGAGKGN
jgi:hypothetical protein